MHTFQFYDGQTMVNIHHNGDYSGDVKIDTYCKELSVPMIQIEIPARALIEFVGEYVRSNRMSKLEDQSTDQLLGIKG